MTIKVSDYPSGNGQQIYVKLGIQEKVAHSCEFGSIFPLDINGIRLTLACIQ